MKKVLLDISVLGTGYKHEEHRTGVYRVCEKTLEALIDNYNYDVYFTSFLQNDTDCIEYLNSRNNKLSSKFVATKKYKLISILSYLFSKKYNIIFSPYVQIPKQYRLNLFSKKYIILYDLIQVLKREWVRVEDFKNYTRFLKSLNKKDNLLCISEYTKKDLLKYGVKCNPKKVTTIPLGVDNRYKSTYTKEEVETVRKKYGIGDKKYFFSVSSMNPRKNFRHTVEGFIKFIENYNITDVSLVLAGPKGWGNLFEGIDLNKYKNQIVLTGFVDEKDLPLLYSGAIASVYLSLYEGFGLPPLESIYCNTPVIASNTTSIPEVVGGAGLLIDPSNIEQLVDAYKTIYEEKFNIKTFQIEAKKQIQKYNWKNFQEKLYEVLN